MDFCFDADFNPVNNVTTPYETLACSEDNFTIATNCTAWSKTLERTILVDYLVGLHLSYRSILQNG